MAQPDQALGQKGGPAQPDRRACRLAHPAAPDPDGHVAGAAGRGARPDLPAGAEIRARGEPGRRLAPVRPVARARRADQLLLRRHAGQPGRRMPGSSGRAAIAGLRRDAGRLRRRHAEPARDAGTGARLLPHHRPGGAQARVRADQVDGPGRAARSGLTERGFSGVTPQLRVVEAGWRQPVAARRRSAAARSRFSSSPRLSRRPPPPGRRVGQQQRRDAPGVAPAARRSARPPASVCSSRRPRWSVRTMRSPLLGQQQHLRARARARVQPAAARPRSADLRPARSRPPARRRSARSAALSAATGAQITPRPGCAARAGDRLRCGTITASNNVASAVASDAISRM